MTSKKCQYGSLRATCIQTGPSPSIPVVLCHGYGAPGDDLVGLVDPLGDWLGDAIDRFLFVFPAAPLSPPELAAYGGRAWWEINMAKLLAASQTGSFDELQELDPPGITQATKSLVELIEAVLAEIGVDSRYVLGGFSQGAMVTMNAVLATSIRPPDLLVQFSGTLLSRPRWQASVDLGRLNQTFVLQSHGRVDNILPFASAQKMHDMFNRAKVSNQFIPFHGPHTIPMEAMEELAKHLKALATLYDVPG